MERHPLETVVRNTPEGNAIAKARANWPFPEPIAAHKRHPEKKPAGDWVRFTAPIRRHSPGIIVK